LSGADVVDIYLTTPVGPFPTAAGASFGTFTTRQDVSPQPLPVIQGGTLRIGSKIWMKATGEVSSTGSPTLILGFYFGTVAGSITANAFWESGAITVATGAAWPWDLELLAIVTGPLGTTASIVGQGVLQMGTSLTAFSNTAVPITQALRTVSVLDTTIGRAIGVCGTWSASSASNTVKVNSLTVQLHN
jgi:hypothetical protein